MCVYTSAFSDVILSFINSMSQIPGIMSKMPPLPVSVDERLASYILPRSPMVNFFCFPHDLQPGAALIVRFLGTDVKIQDQKYTLVLQYSAAYNNSCDYSPVPHFKIILSTS